MSKRQKRDTPGKPDLMEPLVDIMVFGSEDDPCFGKLNDPLNSICKRCGDAEICAIVQGQRLHLKREKQGHEFKDEEEPNLDLERVEKYITKTLAGGPLSLARIQTKVYRYFTRFEQVDRAKSDKMVYDYVKRSPKYKRFARKGTKYLKLK
jgi:hypothetical protein